LARYCQARYVKNGKAKYQVFIASQAPLELSVDRVSYCDPDARAAREERTYVTLETGRVRREVARASVLAKPLTCPPAPVAAPEHAEIHLEYSGLKGDETKATMTAAQWAEHVAQCDHLAALSQVRACDVPVATRR